MPRKKKQRSTQGAWMVMMVPMMNFQQLPQAPSHPGINAGATALASTQGATSSSTSSESEEEDSQEKYDNKMLQVGNRLVAQLPKVRLQDILADIDPRLDAVFTAPLDVEDLCRILWMATGTKPSTPCRNLCVKTCRGLRSKLRSASQRIASTMGSEQHSTMMRQIVSTTSDGRIVMATERGFCDEWFQAKKGMKRACTALRRRVTAQQVRCKPANPEQSAQSTDPPQSGPRGGSPSRSGSNAERRQEPAPTEPLRPSSASRLAQECEGSEVDEPTSGNSEKGNPESDGGEDGSDTGPPSPEGDIEQESSESDGGEDSSDTGPPPPEGDVEQGSSESHGGKGSSRAGSPPPESGSELGGHASDGGEDNTGAGPASPGGGVPDPVSCPCSQADECNRFFSASAQAEQHHDLNDRIVEALPCEEDMHIADTLTSIREFLSQDASDGGVAGRRWPDLMKGAYPEWAFAPLDRSLACLVRRCLAHRGDPGNYRQVQSIEYWSGAAHITLAMVKANQECSRFDKTYTPAHDCLTPMGLRLWMEELCCSSEQCLVWLATQCSSFVALCKAQSQRRSDNQWLGNEGRDFVRVGNQQMLVASLLYFVSFLLSNLVVLEQPVNSVMPRAQPMAGVLQYCGATRTVTWLGKFGASTPKPLQLFHGHPGFGQLKRSRPTSEMETLTTRRGQQFTGKRIALQESQEYPPEFGMAVSDVVAAIRG